MEINMGIQTHIRVKAKRWNLVKLATVVYMETYEECTKIFRKGRSALIVTGTLTTIQSLIILAMFFLINSSILVNLDYFSEFDNTKRKRKLTLTTGKKFTVSNLKVDAFLNKNESLRIPKLQAYKI
jgi:DNA-binding LytR/AlgR family response regulator